MARCWVTSICYTKWDTPILNASVRTREIWTSIWQSPYYPEPRTRRLNWLQPSPVLASKPLSVVIWKIKTFTTVIRAFSWRVISLIFKNKNLYGLACSSMLKTLANSLRFAWATSHRRRRLSLLYSSPLTVMSTRSEYCLALSSPLKRNWSRLMMKQPTLTSCNLKRNCSRKLRWKK